MVKTIIKWIKNYPELYYDENVREIFCTACNIRIKQQITKGEYTVTEERRGKCLKLNFSILSKYNNDQCVSDIFDIDNLAEVRFKFVASGELCTSISLKKHAFAKDCIIKVDVHSNSPKYSQQWICIDNWIDWQQIGKKTYTDMMEICLTVISVNITVIIEKSSIAENIYEDTDWTDFILSTADGSVSVHKACLAAHSDVFRTLLSQEWKETAEGRLQIDGVTLQTLQHLKQYMYLGTLPDDGLCPLLLIATCYLIDNLKSACISKLARTVSSENLEDLLNFASENKITELSLAILQLTPDTVVHGAYELQKNKDYEKVDTE